MGFQLPKLTTDVDCGALGYPGLTFTFWLNATNPQEDWEPPEDAQPWDKLWYVGMARVLEHVVIPKAFSDTGEEEWIEIPDAKAVYDLERMPGFEQMILVWASNVLANERQERLAVARKN